MAAKDKKVGIVMREFKAGTLRSGSQTGPKVKSREQALAIALSEARRDGKDVTKSAQTVADLKAIKADSDVKNYDAKHAKLRALIQKHTTDFYIDSDKDNTWGITHRPTKFKFHLPKEVVADITELQNDAAGQGTRITPRAIEKTTDATPPKAASYKVAAYIIKAAEPDIIYLTLEVADTDNAARRGLMFRNHIPDDYGMFFKTAASFWMKNCPAAIDIAFLDKQGTILEIQHMQPHSETPHSPNEKQAQFSVEFAAGWLDRVGVKAGDRIA